MDLAGDWQYRPDPKGLGEHYPGQLAYTHWDDARWMRDTQDDGWRPATVPGPWPEPQTGHATPIWFRRRFPRPDARPDAWRLELGGVSYRADAWLNGRYLGTHEGYFAPFGFDVTDDLADDNVLVVRVVPPVDVLGEEDQMGQLKRAFVGAFGRWDMNDPERKLAGIWAGVRLVPEPAQAIRDAWLTYELDRVPDEDDLDAPVPVSASLGLELAGRVGGRVTVGWSLTPIGVPDTPQTGRASATVFQGTRIVTIDVDLVVRPWWTWDLGEPRLYELAVWLEIDGRRVDQHVSRTGFRHLALGEGWDLRLNGISLYQRGANYLSDIELSTMTAQRYELDVRLAREANLNTLHPFCAVEAPGFYDECDRQGILVYQDIPLWLMVDTSSEMVSAALSTFEEMHAVLRRHPSVAIWNFGSQPSVANVEKLCTALVRRARGVDPSRIAHLGNAAIGYERHDDTHPTRSFFWARADADRFAAEHGWRRDNHMYPGWYFGDLATIEELPREDFGLVTEFGGQSLPDRDMLAEFMDVDGPVDWRAIARHCGQPELLRRHNPDATTLDELIEHSQRHQAALVRHHTEFIRGRKGDPGRGLHVFAFTDCWPSVTWSVIDYRRRPKPAYHALATAMSPVLAVLSDAAHPVSPGDRTLEIRIVNDGPRDLHAAMLEVQVIGGAATETHRVPLDTVPTDRALRREVDVRIPPGRARITVVLTLRWDGGSVTNRYDVDVRD